MVVREASGGGARNMFEMGRVYSDMGTPSFAMGQLSSAMGIDIVRSRTERRAVVVPEGGTPPCRATSRRLRPR